MSLPISLNLGFGKKKSSSESNKEFDKTLNELQTGQQATTGSTATTSTTAGTSQSNSTGTSQSNQTSTQQNTADKTSAGTSTTTLFSDPVLQGIEALTKNLLGSVGSSSALDSMGTFDSDQFISSTMGAARAKAATDLDIATGGIADAIGGDADSNSMAALLGNRVRGDSLANLQGIEANAVKTASDITNSRTQLALAGQGQQQGLLESVLGQLRGGTTTQTTTGTEGSRGSTTGTGTSNTNTTESNNTNTSQTNTAMELVSQLVNTLLSRDSTESGNENVKTKGKETNLTMSGGLK